MSATAIIILDTRRIKTKTEKYPVKLRVTFKGISKDYQTIYDLSKEDYDKLPARRVTDVLESVRDKLKDLKTKAENIIAEIQSFSFEEFAQELYSDNPTLRPKKAKPNELILYKDDFDFTPFEKRISILKEVHPSPEYISQTFYEYIVRLLKEARMGSALNYQDTYNSLKRFKGNVRFSDITVTYLIQYEQWLRKEGCSKSTVGIKLRPLRAIFNEAIANGLIKREKCYPFGRRKYQIPASKNVKKSLDLSDVQKIYNYKIDSEDEIKELKARDLWLFCYFANGMNPKDMVFLQFKNIKGEYIIFERAKTERATRNDPKPISVYITEDMQRIIKDWGNKDQRPNDYIFPIMRNDVNILEQYDIVKSVVIFMNYGMGKVAAKVGIDKKVTTIVSRHTFSTVLKRSGASTEFIQESLGHTDKKTTENYLDSFEKEMKKDYASRLIAFKTA